VLEEAILLVRTIFYLPYVHLIDLNQNLLQLMDLLCIILAATKVGQKPGKCEDTRADHVKRVNGVQESIF
jgi:hypothetical protein